MLPIRINSRLAASPGESRWRRRSRRAAALIGLLLVTVVSSAIVPAEAETAGDIVLLDAEGLLGSEWTGAGFYTSPVGQADWGHDVTGYRGDYYLDSWNRSDRRLGHLTSQPLTVTRGYLNVLVGGGRHPHHPGGTIPLPDEFFFNLETDDAFATFEAAGNGLDILPLASFGWTGSADLSTAKNSTNFAPGQVGPAVLDTCVGRCDAEIGTVTSPTFTITKDWINLLVGGGNHPWGDPGATAVRLLVDGQTVHATTGKNSATLDWTAWDVRAWTGHQAQIEVVDDRATSDWGHIMIDNVVFEDQPKAPWSYETSLVVRRVIDDPAAPNGIRFGEVLGSVTGNNSSAMVPATIDLQAVAGEQVVIQALDTYSNPDWGHLLIDQIVLSDQAETQP